MPNLRLAPRVTAKKARRPRRRGIRARRGSGVSWWQMIKFAWLIERFRRRRRSSPSIRQIALTVVGVGLAIMVIRAVTRRARAGDTGAPAGAQDAGPGGRLPPSPPPGNDTVASESTLTERVQSEMFRRSGAPAPATESG